MATLVSLNVGLPRDVAWNNRTVHTGIWKTPVAGPRMVRRLNVDGDGQGDLAGHGGENRAVMVYQLSAYRHWAEELGRDDLEPGSFGENFTVEGLADDEVCIGDRYQIGQAVFEVSQPRVTCYRVGLRLGEPRMAALLVAHRLPGFYFRVISEGEVQADDEITKVASGPEQMTVAEIDGLLYLPGHPRTDLQRALRIPALSPGWKGSLQALVEQADAPTSGNTGLTGVAASPPPAWPGFRSFIVAAVDSESDLVRSLWLADPDGSQLTNWLPGQSLTVRLRPDAAHAAIIRNYSLSNSPGSQTFRISVKREPHGAASTYIHAKVRVGDRVDIAAPRGSFVLAEDQDPALLLSAGVGITPTLAMLHWLAEHDPGREVWWLYGARDGTEHPFAAETREVLRKLPRSHSHIFYSQPKTTDVAGIDYTHEGRMTASTFGDIGLPQQADAYLCGPTSFMAGLSAGLVAYGMDPRRIHTETFGATAPVNPGVVGASRPPHPPEGPPGSGPEVSFARSGISARWDGRYASLLELAEACDVPTRWSCRTGVCHTCETAIMSGTVHYEPDPLEAPGAGNVLTCCAQPSTEAVLDL